MADISGTVNQWMNPVTGYAAGVPAKRQTLLDKQSGREEDYLTRFRQGIAKQEALPHMMERFGIELGIPQAKQTFLNLQKTMAELPETYQKATTGMDVNANQLSRIIGTKSAALAPALSTAQTAYETAQSERDKQIAATQAQQQKELQPFQTEQQFMSERSARETSGFNVDAEREYNALMAKANSGIQLTDNEWNRANQLEMQKRSFENQKALNEQQFGFDKQLAQMQNDPLGLFS